MAEIENNTFSRFIRISSIHKNRASDTNTDFHINLNRMLETNNIIRVVFKSMTFANVVYNVIDQGDRKNNIFKYEINGTPYTFEPESGFYSISQILPLLQNHIQNNLDSQLGPGVGTITLSLDASKYKIVFDFSGWTPTLNGADVDASLNKLLGNNLSVVGPINPYVFNNNPNLYGITDLYITSTLIAEQNLVDSDVESHDILARIPVTVPYGTIQKYESSDDELDSITYKSTRNYDSLSIQLRDLDMNIIDLPCEQPVTLLLKVYYL